MRARIDAAGAHIYHICNYLYSYILDTRTYDIMTNIMTGITTLRHTNMKHAAESACGARRRQSEGEQMRIAIGADHAGYPAKEAVKAVLESAGHEVVDLGAHTYDALDDYPDFAKAVSEYVAADNADRGVVLCGSGVGASVASNKVRGIRASVCHDTYSAHQGVEHDDMNILCMGVRIIGEELVREIVSAFASAEFSGEERHVRRMQKVFDMEANF